MLNPKLLKIEVETIKEKRAVKAKQEYNNNISIYTVQKGDNLIKVAEIF